MIWYLFYLWYRLLSSCLLAVSRTSATTSTDAEAMAEQVLLSAEVKHDGKPVTLKITTSELMVVPQVRRSTKAGYLSMDDVYGVKLLHRHGSYHVEVYALFSKGSKRIERTVLFECDKKEPAERIVKTIKAVLANVSVDDELPRRHLLILINPFGGTKKAPKVYDRTLKRMFARAGLSHEVLHTTHRGHATEVAQHLDLTKYDGLCCVSGDGLLNEVVNGIMSRPDWQEAAKMPLGLIPAGSGNGLAQTIRTPNPTEAAFNVIKGNVAPLDLIRLEQEGIDPFFGFLQTHIGLLADVDIESERFRWAGPARFTMSGLQRILALRKYSTKVWYLPAHQVEDPDSEGVRMEEFPEEPHAQGWKLFDGKVVSMLACNVAWASDEFLISPYSSLHDGCIDFMILDETTSSGNLLSWFLTPEAANHIGCPQVKYIKVKALRFEPQEERGILNMDGEVIKNTTTHMSIVPRVLRLMVPRDLKQPDFDASQLPPHGLNFS
eukprot:m.49181 g.49181  ORF g.49181 m.49181 type:complete len:493 (+) comp12454_c1_seq1:83-1561(+)